MSLQSSLLSCDSYDAFLKCLQASPSLQLTLDSKYGWEKISINDREEYFDLESVTLYINALSQRKSLNEFEIRDGREICAIFEGFWTQLGEELQTLNCVASVFYRVMHCSRICGYCDWNPSWLEFCEGESMLTGSHGVFDARLRLLLKNKKN